MALITLRPRQSENEKVDLLTQLRLNQEEMLRRMTRIETRLVKLMLASGLNEDGKSK